MSRTRKMTGTLTCVGCGKKQSFRITSPAAPTLSMCEEAEKVGWSYSIGFFAMLTDDHTPRCPACTKGLSHDRTGSAAEDR